MPAPLPRSGHILVISEKPDAARKIADALGAGSGGRTSTLRVNGVDVFVAEDGRSRHVVAAASGHLYTLADPGVQKSVYPSLDVDWHGLDLVEKGRPDVRMRLSAITKLSDGASGFVNACDYDVEGETIGYNILRYACGGKEKVATRAKFSTLTREELTAAFKDARPGMGSGMAEAGRARHYIDFIWGVNLSRALSGAFYISNPGYKTISMGRVQGPTLASVVDREVGIQSFVPIPWWRVAGLFLKDGARIEGEYERERVETRAEAAGIVDDCRAGNGDWKDGIVRSVKTSVYRQPPPTPFNLGDLQREAYRVFGLSPSATLGVGERLYLSALISYPRTSSQKLPESLGFRKILNGLGRIGQYSGHTRELLATSLVPRQGEKDDPAHPAIHPTGEVPSRALEPREAKLYDLIVKRFIAVFGEDAIRERIATAIQVGPHGFRASGRRTLREGWMKYYAPYASFEEAILPKLSEGDSVKTLSISMDERLEQPPPRFNQSSLLQWMEEAGIGTKATRADIISTLFERGYVTGESISATETGFVVVESMRRHVPTIVLPEMTKEIERDLEGVEAGRAHAEDVVERALDRLMVSLIAFRERESGIGTEIGGAVRETIRAQNTLGPCPVCRDGQLMIIRSRKSGKRFVGCSNYKNGCRASAPLPQKGTIRISGKPCPTCAWPVVYVRLSRIPWKLCVNLNCPSKRATGIRGRRSGGASPSEVYPMQKRS